MGTQLDRFMELAASTHGSPAAKADAAVRPDLKVGFVLWPDFTLLALSGFIDALRLAADIGDRSRQVRCQWTVMSTTRHGVKASCGLSVTPDATLQNPADFDYVIVVGGLMRSIDRAPSELTSYIQLAARLHVPLVGLCTGGIILARAGLMTRRRCCVASYHYRDLIEMAADVEPVCDRLFVEDGDRITCAGGAASIDLATHLIKKHCGPERALKLIHTMIIDEARTPGHSQHRLGIDFQRVDDPRLSRAMFLMEQHMSDPISIPALAAALGTSERQLERNFHRTFGRSPMSFYRALRLKHGRWLVANSNYSIAQIAFDCGFADSSHFSRCFSEEFELTPQKLRRQLRDRQSAASRAEPAGLYDSMS